MQRRIAFCILISFCAIPAAAQEDHGYTPMEIERGEQAYLTNCSNCHGPDGDGISGVSLAAGRFRRAASDEDLMNIILKGIPGAAMPPGNYSDIQAHAIVAYLRSMSRMAPAEHGSTLKGDAARGKTLFESTGQCLNCHRVNGNGGFLGPELSGIGAARRAAALERSLLDPNAEVRADNRTVRAVNKDGAIVLGRLLNQDTYTLQAIDAQGKLLSLVKNELKEFVIMKDSAMPSFQGKLTSQEVADAVAYLATLSGR